MRLNTQNGLALLALVVLAGVLVFFGTRQADAPTEDETTVNEGGALLPEIDTTQVTRFEVRTFPAANADDTAASEPAEVIIERGDDEHMEYHAGHKRHRARNRPGDRAGRGGHRGGLERG